MLNRYFASEGGSVQVSHLCPAKLVKSLIVRLVIRELSQVSSKRNIHVDVVYHESNSDISIPNSWVPVMFVAVYK